MALDTQWRLSLGTKDPTVARYLASKGYQTAGFAANTNCCTYESGLDRGFLHYEDYATGPSSFLTRTVPGKWILQETLHRIGWYHAEKWAALESREASAVNDAFLTWLDRRRTDRPFFTFLNFFDAHDPFIPPDDFMGRFGVRPRTSRDYRLLTEYLALDKQEFSLRDMGMIRDCYEDCIAYLDAELGRLLDELGRRGLLADTDIIVTSDHGETFGDHGLVGHSYSVNLDEVGVPLVILSAEAPGGRMVDQPVSLRDLPATIVDRLGLASDSPFPGRSLAAVWKDSASTSTAPLVSPAFSERLARNTTLPGPDPSGTPPEFEMSIVADGYHYIREGSGGERLYNLNTDYAEFDNLMRHSGGAKQVMPFRRRLLDVLETARGTDAVERGYLKRYRRSLQEAVAATARNQLARAFSTARSGSLGQVPPE